MSECFLINNHIDKQHNWCLCEQTNKLRSLYENKTLLRNRFTTGGVGGAAYSSCETFIKVVTRFTLVFTFVTDSVTCDQDLARVHNVPTQTVSSSMSGK